MKFHYNGQYNGDENSLPHGEHEPNAVMFREPEDSKKLGWIANGISLGLLLIFLPIYYLIGGLNWNMWVLPLYLVSLVVHEFLHALCFRGDVYMYQNLKQGMLFVVGPERMSKARFVFMSLLPTLVFGVIPFVLFVIEPAWHLLGAFGILSICSGAGDFLNVFNALTQMPKGSRTYMYGFHSYWYMPENY